MGAERVQAVSTLRILEPFRRLLFGIPFLYQKAGRCSNRCLYQTNWSWVQVSSASPITALISTKSPISSFAVVQLNGTVDWMIAQRQALLAWTGHSLSIRPTINTKMVRSLSSFSLLFFLLRPS